MEGEFMNVLNREVTTGMATVVVRGRGGCVESTGCVRAGRSLGIREEANRVFHVRVRSVIVHLESWENWLGELETRENCFVGSRGNLEA